MSYWKEQRAQRKMYKDIIVRYTTDQWILKCMALVNGMDLLKDGWQVTHQKLLARVNDMEREHPWLKEIPS